MDIVPFSNITNGTSIHDTQPAYLGFIAAAVSVLFFGTAFLPLKKFDPGDGIFYQWVLACGILIVGMVINIIRGCPSFYPIVMLGGAIWAAGNVFVPSIVKTLGMGVGFCLWSISNVLGGWAAGRFGLFWTVARLPSNETMNYTGVILAASSAFVYMAIKPQTEVILELSILVDDDATEPLIQPANSSISQPDRCNELLLEPRPFYEKLTPMRKRIYGIFFSLLSGLLYGFSFTPSIYVKDNYTGASQNDIDYVLAQFTGTYLMATTMLVIYLVASRNRPSVNSRIILPSIISGIMWGIACSCWFIANAILSETISFPIICTGPTVVCNLCTVFIFKEITKKRDLLILVCGFSVTVAACVLTGLSF